MIITLPLPSFWPLHPGATVPLSPVQAQNPEMTQTFPLVSLIISPSAHLFFLACTGI